MRLINTSTLKLEEFFDSSTPEYVILSHTWGGNEISLQDFQHGALSDKIENCCKQAQKDGFQYAWIDTCCIDKTSSAELSEAINSMYRWYQNSSICYAFLEDYSELSPRHNWWERAEPDTELLISQLQSCRWFTRGWTLQEMIAPSCVKFYDTHWTYFGTRMDLQEVISAITRIPLPVLTANKPPQEYNVAVRMSWASKRMTTRLEDEAYCLMGLFDVNMPMLYGEGSRAFQRLQEEIIKRYEDYSLFAWVPEAPFASFLATTPSDFDEDRLKGFRFDELTNLTGREFGNVDKIRVLPAPSIRSGGLSITVPLSAYPKGQKYRVGWAAICSLKREPFKLFCLPVEQADESSHSCTRRYEGPEDYLIPHVSYHGWEEPCNDLSKFVYTSINLGISVSPQFNASTAFNLGVLTPTEANMRFCSLKLTKIYASLVEDFRAHTTYESADDIVLLFRYANENAEMISGGLIVGLRNGTPWCNILRHMFQADFYSLGGSGRMTKALNKCTDGTGSAATTRDLCRMRIGLAKYNAYLVARISKIGGGYDAPYQRLNLEIAVHFPETGRDYDEIGVLDVKLRLYRDSSAIRSVREDDIVIESGEEPPHWRDRVANAVVHTQQN